LILRGFVDLEIAMPGPISRPRDNRYCAAHWDIDGPDTRWQYKFRRGRLNARAGFFFIWTMWCVDGLARSDNDNVGVT